MDPNIVHPSGGFNPQQYDFITNPAKPAKRSLIPLPGSGGSKKQKILFFVIASLALVTILVLVFSIFFGGKSSGTDKLVNIVQKQNELIRIADIGEKKAQGEETKNLAVNIKLSVTSQQNDLIDYLKKNGKKVSTKELSIGKNTETDSALDKAESNGRFDEAFTSLISEQISDYMSSLQDTYSSISGKNAKQLISDDYNQTKLLTAIN